MTSLLRKGSNAIEVREYRGKPSIQKNYLSKPKTLKWWKYQFLRCLGIDVPIEYRSAVERLNFERRTLSVWSQKGYRVPKVLSSTPTSLILEHIDGCTLEHHLHSSPLDEKWKTIEQALKSIRERHCQAILERDHYLIQYDSNLRNTIFSEQGLVFVDFEMGHFGEKIERSAVRELQKWTLEVANILGREQFPKLIDSIQNCYGIESVLNQLIKKTLDRPLKNHHLKRDAKKKRKKPHLITKIDLARALQEKKHEIPREPVDPNLLKIEQISWDGKLYQTLRDRIGGRNMVHRYQIMQFPDDFSRTTVLDIGCNLGRICLDAAERGAKRSVGLDFRDDVMQAMRQHVEKERIPVEFYPFDINCGLEALQNIIGKETFDRVYILSIWSHVDWPSLAEIVKYYCKKECIFEDNAPSRIQSLKEIEKKLRTDLEFNQCEFLGYTSDRGVRSVFRLSKD